MWLVPSKNKTFEQNAKCNERAAEEEDAEEEEETF